ncbi:alpha-1,2-mannosyltransferase ALG9 isoform X1 [Cimex lectularius]|uniref:Mannosyltransferase n=1 Tax=Cimex lectularius TaxID=79782 RepID=A0A8I6RBP3_CIMLE|nr:alpha-1,2-mannosyltransferase ALG9 isoform X1 [Cimex lectularius]
MPHMIRQRNNPNSPNIRKNGPKWKHLQNRSEAVNPSNAIEYGLSFPTGYTAFKVLLSARIVAAIWSHITDCDETFNYWEPSFVFLYQGHYLLYGKGLQTWEYSPKYALRSYTYLLFQLVPALIYNAILRPERLLLFYFQRCLLAVACSVCEVYFYKSICREFGIHVGRMTLIFQLFSAGMYISSTAFLPSSFSMYMTMLSIGAWYHRKYELAVFLTAISSFLSWPFAALIGVPIAYDMVFMRKEIGKFTKWCLISCFIILLPMIKIDSMYYGKWVIAPLNIVLYNVFSSHGPDLYGTEPWYFYLLNGFLNFNFVFLSALLTPIALWTVSKIVSVNARNPACLPYSLSLLPLYLWLGVFMLQSHKEERFLFPVYPMICLCGALTVDAIQKIYFRLFVRTGQHYLHHTSHIVFPAVFITSLLGVTRILALYKGYHAPMDTYMELNKMSAEGNLPTLNYFNICVGKEWYRFPTSFFLPNDRWTLQFLKSEFSGQLPKYYSQTDGTSVIPDYMNNENKEEITRYGNLTSCHFLVDLDIGQSTDYEPNYSSQVEKWVIVKSIPFLNNIKTSKWVKAFYIPYIWERNAVYGTYNLLQARKMRVQPSKY